MIDWIPICIALPLVSILVPSKVESFHNEAHNEAYLNIGSIRNKFENLFSLLANKFDILITAKTKLDGSFPTNDLLIKSFHQPFQLDISKNSGGLLIYINILPAEFLSNYTFPSNIQAIRFEFNLKKRKWLFMSICKRSSKNSHYFLNSISKHGESY